MELRKLSSQFYILGIFCICLVHRHRFHVDINESLKDDREEQTCVNLTTKVKSSILTDELNLNSKINHENVYLRQYLRHVASQLKISLSLLEDHHSALKVLDLSTASATHAFILFELQASRQAKTAQANLSGYAYSTELKDNTLFIKEYYNNNATNGGTAFKIVIRGEFMLDLCSYVDLLNGTYKVACPSCEFCRWVTILAYSANYTSYVADQLLYNLTEITTKELCSSTQMSLESFLEATPVCENIDFTQHGRLVFALPTSQIYKRDKWSSKKLQNYDAGFRVPFFHKDGGWLAWQNGGCFPSFVNRHMFEKCLSRIDRMVLIGNSHLRFMYYYMLEVLQHHTDLPDKLYSYHKTFNMEFYWAEVIENIKVILNDSFYSNEAMTNRDSRKYKILLLNTLYWELAKPYGSFRYMRKLAKLVIELESLQRHYSNLKILWVSGVPVVDSLFSNSPWRIYKTLHTNPTRLALNKWTADVLRSRGMHVFDHFRLLWGMTEESVDNIHYLRIEPIRRSHNGSLGDLAANLLLHYVCQLTDT